MNSIGSASQSHHVLQSNQTSMVQSADRISSGKRINSAADDAAGLAISQRMSTQSTAMSAAQKNIGDGASMLQSRDGALQSIGKGLARMQELGAQANSGILNDSDRSLLNKEFTAIKEQITSIVKDSEFNGNKLFSDTSQALQSGPDAGQMTQLSSNNAQALLDDADFAGLSINNSSEIGKSLSALEEVQSGMLEFQAQTGADLNTLASQSDALSGNIINTEASRSRIEDADMAKEITKMSQNDIKDQIMIAMQGHANSNQKSVLALLSS